MGLLSWLVVGLLVGLTASKLMSGRGSWLPTLVLATIGALVGGYVSVYFNWGTLASLHPRALLLALTGALLLTAVARVIRR
ncbi:GlsB/YeaQ/YmgE family stress response membrane protein [Pantoea sp. FN0302]|uniref:GlsB/YeaQ/YmgE family stress response membrane protein n=1 Tax=unclassified Pantoea TaxID=2630326 RepID=UPI003CEACDF7